jgi:hypothetical protein
VRWVSALDAASDAAERYLTTAGVVRGSDATGDIVEGGAEMAAEQTPCGNADDCDESRNQPVLDGRDSSIILD